MRRLPRCAVAVLLVLHGACGSGPNAPAGAGPVSPVQSTIDVDRARGVVADGNDQACITVTLRDARGRPVSGKQVVLEASGTDNDLAQPSTPSDAQGIATAWLRSARAERKVVRAWVSPVVQLVALHDFETIEFVGDAASIDPGRARITVEPSVDVPANGSAQAHVLVTVTDTRGNGVPGQIVQLAVTGTGNVVRQPGPTNASGIAAGSITSTKAETKTVTATVNPGPREFVVPGAPAVEFVADAAGISAASSHVTVTPAFGRLADGAETASVTVTVVDAHGNPVPGQPVELGASGSGNTISLLPATNASGVTSGTVRTTCAEAKTLTATVRPGAGPVVLAERPVVRFVWPLPRTYYVRTSGADGNPGTSPAAAWRTLARAAAAATPGDTIWVGAGTWTERVHVTTSGTSGAPIRFLADRDGAHTGDAGEVRVVAPGTAEVFHIDDADWITVGGFTLSGATSVTPPGAGIRVTGSHATISRNRVYGNVAGIEVQGNAGTFWNPSWNHRRRITFGTSHSLLPAGFTARLTMDTRVASTPVALASGNDVRIVWHPTAGAAIELDRRGSGWNTASTAIEFRLRSDIAPNQAEATDGSYFVYYGNAAAPPPPTDENQVYYFAESFDRPDSTVIGNGWTEWTNGGQADILAGKLRMRPTGDANPPQVGIKQSFPLGAIPGDFTVSFDWDVPPNNESLWSFWGVNIGNAAVMVDGNRTAGVGPALFNGEGLGFTGTEAIDNDMSGALENNVRGAHTYRLVVRRAGFRFDYWRDDVLRAADVPFATSQNVLDQYRIGGDNFFADPGEEWTIDNIKIVLDVTNPPEPALEPEETPLAGAWSTLEDNTVSANQAGIVVRGAGSATVRNNLVYGQLAGGIAIRDGAGSATVTANTLYGNAASQILVDGSGCSVTVRDNIIVLGGSAGIELLPGSSTLLHDHNDVWAHAGTNFVGTGAGPGDISQDPLLVDPDGADDQLGGASGTDDRFELADGSPAIDTGSDAALALVLSDGTPFADRSTRVDRGLDGIADGATVNLGFHHELPGAALAPLAVGDARLVLGEGGDRCLRLRTWRNAAAGWEGPLRSAPAGSPTRWCVHGLSPLADGEEMVAVLSGAAAATQLDVLRWDGTGWRRDWSSSALASADSRGFALAYEGTSGDALVVWGNGANPTFRVRSRGAWSAPAAVFATPPGSAGVVWIELVPRPRSDEIALVFADAAGALHAVLWSGTTWEEATSETTLSSTLTTTSETRAFDATWEEVSGDLLVTWGNRATSDEIGYATLDATTRAWTASTLTGTLAIARLVRLAADPASDRIAAVITEGAAGPKTVGLVWDGAGWSHLAEIDATSAGPDAAIAWSGGTAVLVWADAGGSGAVDWARWSPSGWAVQGDVAVSGLGAPRRFLLRRLPGNAVMLLCVDDDDDLYALLYDGVAWTVTETGQPLTTALSAASGQPFDLRVR